jgi:hypothetical protein
LQTPTQASQMNVFLADFPQKEQRRSGLNVIFMANVLCASMTRAANCQGVPDSLIPERFRVNRH